MDLFSGDTPGNLLPFDGTVLYYGRVLPLADANRYFNSLLADIPWQNDEAIIMGKHIVTARKVAWFAEKEYSYTYSKITKKALLFTPLLMELKNRVEQVSGETYNACLLNLYHNGNEGMAWHSDSETMLKPNGAIASLTFGAERKFAFKHKQTGQTVSLLLEHGSLLVMKDETQHHWLHRLPPTQKHTTARINLTFRTIRG